jgi:phosphatidylserine/phosphatidylglycerophosphate/cardiolipin synthase-like enzyme
MTCAATIGADLARSLVIGLGADCPTAAALARVMAGRHGTTIDVYNLADWPTSAVQRVITDFVARDWLRRLDAGWLVGPSQIPPGLAPFLEGAAAMRAIMPDDGRATAVVTMPPAPSAIGAALPTTGVAHAALVTTQETFERLAEAATNSFTIMTPFLNDEGLVIALDLFCRTRARRKHLIVRRSGVARAAVDRRWNDLSNLGVIILNYALPAVGGYETFHAKVLLADQDLAYVGSANMTAFARHSMELGILADGRAARVVASIVRSVERIATRVDARAATPIPSERRPLS